jgi:hypothetical protein
MHMCKIITSFSTEFNIKLCSYIKNTIESHNSNSTAYRVQYSHKFVFQETNCIVFYSMHCTSNGIYGPFLTLSISHIRMNKTPRLYIIRFLILDAAKLQPC